MIELVQSGRSPEALAQEFKPSAQTIRNWVVQAARDAGERQDGPTTAEADELRRLRQGNRRLREEREILAKATAWNAAETDEVPSGSSSSSMMNQADHHVTTMCRVLAVSPSGYYAWRQRSISVRQIEDSALRTRIQASYQASGGTYGRPRIHADLDEEGWRVGGKRVARLMRAEGVCGVARRKAP